MLKTTQSGYEGFLHDKYTLLPDTKERMVATSITSTWKCAFCTCAVCTQQDCPNTCFSGVADAWRGFGRVESEVALAGWLCVTVPGHLQLVVVSGCAAAAAGCRS